MADLELTLTWLGMDRYLERFIDAGFDSWETVLEITEEDLNILNVDLGHRRKLQREIANTKRLARDPAFVTPLYGIDPSPPNPRSGVSSSSTDVQQGAPPTKRGYRHHPKPDPNTPERPYSAYVLFSNHTREQLKEQNLSFIDLSKVVGEKWQQLSREQKEEWKKRGAAPWERYKAELAAYQKTDESREYQRYLADFRAAQIAKHPQGKSATILQDTVSSTHRHTSLSSKQPQMAVSHIQQPESEGKRSKVAIKRLKREEESWSQGPSPGLRSPRVRQACESCRNKKIKCYGEQPTCRHCRELGIECYYASGRRDKRRRQDDEVWQKLRAYEELLLKIVRQLDGDDQQAVQEAMLMPPYDAAAKNAYQETIKSRSQSGSHGDVGDSDDSGAGSMGPTDEFNQDDSLELQTQSASRGPGFAGQSSDVKWTERLDRELLPKQAKRSKSQNASQTSRPYAEDMDAAVVGHQIDPFSLPVKSTADSLVNAYFSTIHTSFPILNKMDFMNQYDQLYSTMDPEGFEQRIFIAKLQLVFAIAAVHAHLIQAHWAGDARDHMLYFSQARVLAVDTGIFNDECDLSQVHIFALGGMYLLVTNQLNRAWNISGLAVKSAQALGLQLRDVSTSVSAESKELHAYNWFALMILESMLTLMTGRPSMINLRDCSVRIPTNLAEGEPPSTSPTSESSHQRSATGRKHRTSSSDISQSEQRLLLDRRLKYDTTQTAAIYFVHYTELCILAKEVVGELYQPGIRKKKRLEVQNLIDRFDRRLFDWKDGLNSPLDVASESSDPETESCRVALRILFHSTRTVINRPCLCRIQERIQDHESSSKWKNISSANKCVESARATLNLILHKPDSIVVREGTMWWMLLHHHKRALTVLLLELAFRAEHMPSSAGEILAEAKASLSWLNGIGKSSNDARRTYSHMRKLLGLAAQKVGGDTSDMAQFPEEEEEDEGPPPYAGQQQPPYDSAGHDQIAFAPEFQEPWQYYGDLTARNELDQFGFLRAEGGMGSLFPTASEMERMNEGQGEDYDMDRNFEF